MKATHPRLQKPETSNQPLPVVAARLEMTRAFRRLFIEVTEKPIGAIERDASPRRIFEQLSDVHVKCSDPNCRNGGVFLAPIIREMLQNEEAERLVMEMCPGRVPSSNRKLVRVRCQNMFCIKVLLV